MTARQPDSERRLVPRWRSSREAFNAGDLRSPRARASPPIAFPEVPQFDALINDWRLDPGHDIAADLVSTGVALGRTSEKEVQEAARVLESEPIFAELRSLARCVLEGTIGLAEAQEHLPFDINLARAQLQAQIAFFKQRVRSYPRNAVAWVDLARLYTAAGQQGKAREAIRIATVLAPNNRFVLRSTARFFVHSDGKHRDENIEEGLHLLRSSQLLRGDPWIMAAEISLATIAGKGPKSLRWARSLADKDALDPWDSSELNGALGTLALAQGGAGRPSRLFARSIRSPTENALAQAQWAANCHHVIQVPEQTFSKVSVAPYEALALRHRIEQKWNEVIADCRAWSETEPTSARPLILASHVASLALEDADLVREFAERALMIEPHEPWAHNNLAVGLAYQGKLIEAEEHASKFEIVELDEEAHPVYLATKGLIEYRRGRREEGFALYRRAARTPAAQRDRIVRALLMWHLLREEARVGAPNTAELSDLLWKHTRNLPIPELETMRERIIHPPLSVTERASRLIRSTMQDRGKVPSMKSIVAEDIGNLFDPTE